MMFLLVLAAGRIRAQQHNYRPLSIWGTRICHHGRAALQSCWRCYNEIALQWAIGLARAS